MTKKKNITGILITIFSVIIGILSLPGIIKDLSEDAKLEFQLVSEYDTTDDFFELYSKDSIARKKNIKILSIKVINTGDEVYRENDYDKLDSLRINLGKAAIIKKPYIRYFYKTNKEEKNVSVRYNDSTLYLPQRMIKPDEYYYIDFVLSSTNNDSISFNIAGRSAVQDEFYLDEIFNEEESDSWLPIVAMIVLMIQVIYFIIANTKADSKINTLSSELELLKSQKNKLATIIDKLKNGLTVYQEGEQNIEQAVRELKENYNRSTRYYERLLKTVWQMLGKDEPVGLYSQMHYALEYLIIFENESTNKNNIYEKVADICGFDPNDKELKKRDKKHIQDMYEKELEYLKVYIAMRKKYID